MASSFIPSSKPANGRTSIRSLRRSNRSSNRCFLCTADSVFRVRCSMFGVCCWNTRLGNAQSSTSTVRVGRWTLGVERWALDYFLWRVKGAWWPSRSSKPSLVGNGRGRFDSYPLRHDTFNRRCLTFEMSTISHQTSTLTPQTFRKGVT